MKLKILCCVLSIHKIKCTLQVDIFHVNHTADSQVRMKSLTLYIDVSCSCFRSPYSVTGCTAVWPWSPSLYVGDCVVWSIGKACIGTVCLEPSPCDASVGVCITHCTHQCSCFSFYHSVWTWWTWSYIWFIYPNISKLTQIP